MRCQLFEWVVRPSWPCRHRVSCAFHSNKTRAKSIQALRRTSACMRHEPACNHLHVDAARALAYTCHLVALWPLGYIYRCAHNATRWSACSHPYVATTGSGSSPAPLLAEPLHLESSVCFDFYILKFENFKISIFARPDLVISDKSRYRSLFVIS